MLDKPKARLKVLRVAWCDDRDMLVEGSPAVAAFMKGAQCTKGTRTASCGAASGGPACSRPIKMSKHVNII